MTTPLRIIFAGTPDFAASSLAALINSEHQVIAVYTQPDRPAGRGRKLKASPVKSLATSNDIPVFQPQSLKGSTEQAELAALNADLMVVVAYGLLLPKAVLDIPRHGCINVHASLLPRWRGAAPIHRSLLAGDAETGITIMQMDEGLDTGDMLYKSSCDIQPDDTSGSLHDRLAEIGATALIETLRIIQMDQLNPIKQNDADACYAHKLAKQEGLIDWSDNAEDICRQIRGLSPWPIAYTILESNTLRILKASPFTEASPVTTTETTPGTILETRKDSLLVACGNGTALAIERLQLPGGKPLLTRDVLNSRKELFSVGVILGENLGKSLIK
ncbi:methionyl-tRNA formyltransferase [Neptunomonas qingdaonensis]|uniref:Methionyl-tRNA formyltransferase n=1 Tax=Neptunomonas qingdaonensis TaxID=1045558 RepID=A0A1I2LPX0_9GAMM|nr:methionyl-tRNA formyltransferase [Neptunomonas qingdaonensis]SFF79076.1 methionyl-tRNA formyltransferase [Neptunomonas qingdaonensis]